jgi:hypothetical protein
VALDVWAWYEDMSWRDWAGLDHQAQLFVAFGELREEVNNGGFDQYFFNSAGDHALEALAAARAGGADAVADLLDAAMRVLVGGYRRDRFQRQDALLAVTAGGAFDELDAAYYAVEETADLDAVMGSLVADT